MAGLSCGAVFVKYILCLFNFTFFAAGGLILALSTWLAVDNTSFLLLTRLTDNPTLQVYNTPSVLEQGAYVLIAAGGLVFILGFLGCCGAAMESRSLLTTYGLLIIVLFMLQVAGGVLAAVYRTQAEDELEDLLKFSLQKYYSTPQRANAVTLAWDAVMEELECCGVNNYTDFEKAALWQTNKTNQQVVPLACCASRGDDDDGGGGGLLQDDPLASLLPDYDYSLQQDEPLSPRQQPLAAAQRQRNRQRARQKQQQQQLLAGTCVNNPTAANSYYLTGCLPRIYGVLFNNLPVVLSAAVLLGTLQMLLVTLACYVCRALQRQRSYKDVMDD